jgi:prepilin-type N-terminal cleavage/methylation domain-containing protein
MTSGSRYWILESSIEHRASSIKHRASSRGFTLIEVIIFLVVAGVIASAVFIPFLTSLKRGMTPEKVTTASYLAQAKMEELTKYTYSDSNLDPLPLTTYVQAHLDATYFHDYDWQWEIKYVDESLSDSACDVGYKQILVRVRDPDGESFEVTSIAADF